VREQEIDLPFFSSAEPTRIDASCPKRVLIAIP